MKESADRMENIPFIMVLHNYVDGVGARFNTMSGPLSKNSLIKWL